MRLIDADKLRKDIQFVLDTLGEPTKYGLRQAMSIIDKTPTVEAERHGHWVKENEEDTFFCVYKCSLCGGEVLSEAYLFKYCPYCGCAIKMEVEE